VKQAKIGYVFQRDIPGLTGRIDPGGAGLRRQPWFTTWIGFFFYYID
jgi:hypothetical protein